MTKYKIIDLQDKEKHVTEFNTVLQARHYLKENNLDDKRFFIVDNFRKLSKAKETNKWNDVNKTLATILEQLDAEVKTGATIPTDVAKDLCKTAKSILHICSHTHEGEE